MNYLAHALLSTDDAEVLTGNIIADIAKGAVRKQLQPKYLTGIEMHRYIDQFTDQYPALKAIKKKLQPWTGRYTPVLLDIYMDFFIGAKWDEYSDQGKQEFETMIYNKLNSQVYDLTTVAQYDYPRMVAYLLVNFKSGKSDKQTFGKGKIA